MCWGITMWKLSKYLAIKSPYSVEILKNTDQKKTPYLDTFHAVCLKLDCLVVEWYLSEITNNISITTVSSKQYFHHNHWLVSLLEMSRKTKSPFMDKSPRANQRVKLNQLNDLLCFYHTCPEYHVFHYVKSVRIGSYSGPHFPPHSEWIQRDTE